MVEAGQQCHAIDDTTPTAGEDLGMILTGGTLQFTSWWTS